MRFSDSHLEGRIGMTKRRTRPTTLPALVVKVREGQPSPAQGAAWVRLWQRLVNPEKDATPAGGEAGRGGQVEAADEEVKPPT